MILEATLKDGTVISSEFSKLGKVGKYVNEVFSGRKAFNGWKVIGNTHPASGEEVVIRERVMVNGDFIAKIREVNPDGSGVQSVMRGERGLWTAPTSHDDAVEGATAGAEYPVHRDTVTMTDYVIIRAAEGETPETRHYINPETSGVLSEVQGGEEVGFDAGEDNVWDDSDGR